MLYNSSNGETTWLTEMNETAQFVENYINYYNNQVKNRYSVSLKIEDTDFYRWVWDNTDFSQEEEELPVEDDTMEAVPEQDTGETPETGSDVTG